MYRVLACVLLYLSLGSVFDGVRMAKFERIAETVATTNAEQQDADRK